MNSCDPAIIVALRGAGLPEGIRSVRDLSGGCIHHVVEITLNNGQRVVVKMNRAERFSIFEEEARGLRALADTVTVMVPQVLATVVHRNQAVLLITAIDRADSPSQTAWNRLGLELAALHQTDAGTQYGFDHHNHIGSTFQSNSWCGDWIEFNAVHRLGYQIKTAKDRGLLDRNETQVVQKVIERLDRLIPRHPKPALLHGDLWSGNAIATNDDRIAVIDPACSIGDGWADIAMMRLFGGFPSICYTSYSESVHDHDAVEDRIAVYQLYHILNHVNIFGRGYVSQAMDLAQRLC